MMNLVHSHSFPRLYDLQKEKTWKSKDGMNVSDRVGKRVGILGYGSIGRQGTFSFPFKFSRRPWWKVVVANTLRPVNLCLGMQPHLVPGQTPGFWMNASNIPNIMPSPRYRRLGMVSNNAAIQQRAAKCKVLFCMCQSFERRHRILHLRHLGSPTVSTIQQAENVPHHGSHPNLCIDGRLPAAFFIA